VTSVAVPQRTRPARGLADRELTSLTALLRDRVPQLSRFCTPSILREQEIVLDLLDSDVSVSFSAPGALIGHTGTFASTARLIADLHGADEALLVTNGSTGANQVALSAIARMTDGLFLIDRQCHHSVPSALTAFGLDWAYIGKADWDATWETPGPVTAADVVAAILEAPRCVACVVLTSPTYAGESANLAGIVAAVRCLESSPLIHVDAAWFSHAPFVEELRSLGAMAAGADTASVSLHKQAGSLQPGAALLARKGRICLEALHAAYAEIASTSQSLIIAASIDASQRYLAEHGTRRFESVVNNTRELKEEFRALSELRFLDELRPGPHDPTKLTLLLDGYAVNGYEAADALERTGVVAEKATPNTLTFLTTLSTTVRDVHRAVDATARILEQAGSKEHEPARLPNPYEVMDSFPVINPTRAVRRSIVDGECVSTAEAIGRIAAERIEAYPPGTAVVFEGFRITAAAINWLRTVRDCGGALVARDKTLTTVRVLPEDCS
jgi:arginine decarboxylase